MLGKEAQQQNRQWLGTSVNHILEPMMLKLIQDKPDDHINFMIKYMEEQFGERATAGDISLIA